MSSLNQFPSFIDPSLNLPPPGGMDHIDDEDDDSDRYELWTFRVPSTMNVSDLDGVEIDMDAIRKNKNSGGMKVSDGKYAVSLGDGVENENFRVLVPSHRNDEDEDDSSSNSSSSNSNSNSEDESNGNKETNKFLLCPASKAFSRHLNIHTTELLRKSEAELAPLEGPEPTDDVLRHAYSHIPQRKGLKRRWMPLGAPQSAKDIPSKLITLQPDRAVVAAAADAAAPVSSDDDNEKPRRKSVGSKNRSAEPSGDAQQTSVTPKTKRIKKEKGGSSSKSSEKSSKKSSKKSKKHRKKNDDALSV